MSSNAIVLHWGTPIPTRERMALEEFASYMTWANKLKKDGKIQRFEVYELNDTNYQKHAGFTVLEGTEQQIRNLTDSDDYQARIQRVMNVVHNFRVEHCVVGDEAGKRMQSYGNALQQLKL